MRKKIKIFLEVLTFVLILLGGINFFTGVLSNQLDNYAKLTYSGSIENIDNLEIYSVTYSSDRAFIQNNPIELHINVSIFGDKELNDDYYSSALFLTGDCEVCNYPLKYTNNVCESGINLSKSNGNKELIGEGKIVFLNYGDCKQNISIIDDTTKTFDNLKGDLQISPIESWLNIKSNQYILSLTLILIGLATIPIIQNMKKDGN